MAAPPELQPFTARGTEEFLVHPDDTRNSLVGPKRWKEHPDEALLIDDRF